MITAILVLSLMTSDPSGPGLSMALKARLFQHDIEHRFMVGNGQVACKLHVPTEARPHRTYNMPDNAYMTGIYVAALSWKYAATKDSADREAARRSLDALNLLATVSGKPGLLARAAWPADGPPHGDDGEWSLSEDGKWLWRGDVSSDQMDGVMFGYAAAFDTWADEDDKRTIAANVSALVGHVLDNDLRIIDADGIPTRWGRYMPEYVQIIEPLNALLLLQLLKVAEHVTGEDRFTAAYRKYAIDERYSEYALQARRTAGRINFSDDVLLFLGYYPLLKYESDPVLRERYIESLRRSWNGSERCPGAKAQGNPFYAFVASEFLGDRSGLAAGIDTLRWFPLDMKWNRPTIEAYEAEFGFKFDSTPQSPTPESGQAIPVDRREKSWSAWVMDPYRSAGTRLDDQAIEYNGHDYLLGYWLGRSLGVVDANL